MGPPGDGSTIGSLPVLDQLDGEFGYRNWASFPAPASLRMDDSFDVIRVLRLADGLPFALACATSGLPVAGSWRIRSSSSFESESRTIADPTFGWS